MPKYKARHFVTVYKRAYLEKDVRSRTPDKREAIRSARRKVAAGGKRSIPAIDAGFPRADVYLVTGRGEAKRSTLIYQCKWDGERCVGEEL
jgi:hypothetical protein